MRSLSLSVKSTMSVILIASTCMYIVSCSSSEGTGNLPAETDPNTNIPAATTDDIAFTLLKNSDYSTLMMLIERAGLTEVLQDNNGGEGWTFFAPSDIAFGAVDDISQLTTEGSAELIRLHMLPGKVTVADLEAGRLSMDLGAVDVATTGTGITVGGATIVGQDRAVGNGIIHFVNAVLVPAVN